MSPFDISYKADDLLWTIAGLPITLVRPRGPKWQIHLNSFINLGNRFRQNNYKQTYTVLLKSMLQPVPVSPYTGKVRLLYVYYAPNKIRRDLDNMTSVVMKFTNDALVQYGFLVDDSTSQIQNIHLSYGGIDPEKFNHIDLYIFKDD